MSLVKEPQRCYRRGACRLERDAPFPWRIDAIAVSKTPAHSSEHVHEASEYPFDAAAVHSIRKYVGAEYAFAES
jgi:hypothetical protein